MQQKTVTKKLIFELVLALLILGACIIVGSYAWLTRTTALKAENYNMQILAPDIVVRDYKVYQYNAETNKVDNVTTSSGLYEMTQYDSIFLERNVYTPLLFVMELGNVTPGSISVNVYCNTDHTDPHYSSDPNQRFTSNIACVKAASGYSINNFAVNSNGGALVYEETDDARMHLFDSAAKYFKTDNNKGQFCSVTESGGTFTYGTKKTNISFTLPIVDGDFTTLSDGTRGVRVFLIVDYDALLVKAQQLDAFSDIEIQNRYDKPVAYKNDITTIFFESVKD